MLPKLIRKRRSTEGVQTNNNLILVPVHEFAVELTKAATKAVKQMLFRQKGGAEVECVRLLTKTRSYFSERRGKPLRYAIKHTSSFAYPGLHRHQ
jgi:hypothetical protein